MDQRIRQDILAVLQKAGTALDSDDEAMLATLSNETIHNASIYQDDDSIDIAVAMYALSKLIARGEPAKRFASLIRKAELGLRNGDAHAYERIMHTLLRQIRNGDSSMGIYIQHVLDQAKLKKSAKLYDHGISLAQSASKLGISQWQLYNYIGKTTMTDNSKGTIANMKKRLAYTRALFR